MYIPTKLSCFLCLCGLVLGSVSMAKGSEQYSDGQTSASKVLASANLAQKTIALEFNQAIHFAQSRDPWLQGNQHSQQATRAMSVAAGTLPDPQVSLGLLNVPVDSFSLAQEGMTQVRVGVAQMFPRGDSLLLKQRELAETSEQFPFQREDRKGKVAVIAGQLWLDGFKAQQTILLIENNRALFEQLADVAQAGYASASNKTRQHDLIRAQLELTRLDDRLNMLKQQFEMSRFRLAEWLSESGQESEDFVFSDQLPQLKTIQSADTSSLHLSQDSINRFVQHPSIKAIELKIAASQTTVELAKQQYKPEWGVNAGYALRENDAMGNSRADFFSIGVTFDIPLFTANRQDKQVAAAISSAAAVKTERWALLRNLSSAYATVQAQQAQLDQRHELYTQRLLPQIHQQAEASLTAYTNDDGDFAEVVRARIAELNANIDFLNIQIEQQKNILQLNYFLMQRAPQMISMEQSIQLNNGVFQ